MKIRQMTIEDYDDIIVLLQETPGVTVRDADSKSLFQSEDESEGWV